MMPKGDDEYFKSEAAAKRAAKDFIKAEKLKIHVVGVSMFRFAPARNRSFKSFDVAH